MINKNIAFIVGEGSSIIKSSRMSVYVQLMQISECMIIKGYDSDKDYEYDGYDVLSKKSIEQLREIDSKQKKNYDSTHAQILHILEFNPIIIMMKPPRELVELFLKNKNIFKNTMMFLYGGFNIRCLFGKYSKDTIKEFISSFKGVIFYESFFAIGEANNINNIDINFDCMPDYLLDLIEKWNISINSYCKNVVANTNNLEVIKRNNKIIDSIEKSRGRQFVDADCGMVLTMLSNIPYEYCYPCNIDFDENNYSVIKKNDNSNILVVNPDDANKEKLKNDHIEYLNRFFKNIKIEK